MIFKIDRLIKEYGRDNNYQRVLDDINLEFKSGEFICILGESGSGKSSLLNIIGGLDTNYEGSVNYNNLNLKYINLDNYRKNNIGFIFQNFNLINNMSIVDNIILPLDKSSFSYKEKINKAYDLLKKLNIYNIKNKRINDLSGGQKQRVAIARALINDPDIILADEPTGALDEKNSENILDILKEISQNGKLVIVVTHSMKVIDYSTRVLNIKDGKISSDKRIKRVKESRLDMKIDEQKGFMYLIKYGVRSLFNNGKRNIFITIASSIGIVGVILSLFIGNGVKGYISDLITSKTDITMYSIKKEGYDIYTDYTYTKKEIEDIESIKHIDKVIKEKNITVSSINLNKQEYNISFLDSFNSIELEKGNDKGLVISNFVYNKIGDKNIIGKSVTISIVDSYKVIKSTLKVSGISKDSGISLVDDNMHAYINYSVLEDIYNKNKIELEPNNISIKIDNKDNIEYVKNKLKSLSMKCSNNNELYDDLSKYLDIATYILMLLSSLSLIVSVIMISIIISITVLERTKEIGLLRSIGYSKKDIRLIFSSESIFLGLFIGIFSVFLSSFIINIIVRVVKNKFDILLNTNSYKYYFFGIVLSIFILLIASYFPSKKASNQDPIISLKYE